MEKFELNPTTVSNFDPNYLIGKHVKMDDEKWTKVYRVSVLLIPGDDEVSVVINEGVSRVLVSEPNPTLLVKKHRWWRW